MPLVESLQGHGTGWCTAGESTARAYLEAGDFYIYYSVDPDGKPTIPRVTIRMKQDTIAEVRGIAFEQNLDPYIGEVVQGKLKEFPDGQLYQKKSSDMKLLTAVENKVKTGTQLTKDDLIFLYEINASIKGFGYQRDPRIAELRAGRNPKADMPIIFECHPKQIARTPDEINQNTRAYVGKLAPGIFQRLPDTLEHLYLENLYTTFPEGKIHRDTIEIGGKTAEQLERELEQAGIKMTNGSKAMLGSDDFVPSKNMEQATLIHLMVVDLGFTKSVTTDQIYQRAKELGLELCPAEVGPHYRLTYRQDQSMDRWSYVGMKQITDSDGFPDIFSLECRDGGLWLDIHIAKPDYEWDPTMQFAFRLPPKK